MVAPIPFVRAVVMAGVAAAGITAVGAQQAGQVVAPGLVMGRVVDRDDDRPIGGALVETAPVMEGAPSTARMKQLTDGDGRFVFRGLPAGTYEIRVSTGGSGFSPAGYIQSGLGAPIGAYLPGGPGQRRPGGPVEPLSLAQGQTVPDLLVRLWKGAAIGGTVRDDLGDPLVDAVVGAVRLGSDGRWLTGPTTRTDDLGRYRLSALAPGRYVVFVPQVTLGRLTADLEAAIGRSEALAAAAGERRPPPETLTGVSVGDAIIPIGVRDAANNYAAPVAAGDALRVFRTTFHPNAVATSAAGVIAVASGDELSAVDVTLSPGAAFRVSGRLERAGAAVAGVVLRLFPAAVDGGQSVILETAEATTDAAGRFVFPLVPAGRYVARFVQPAARSGVPGSARSSASPGAWVYETVTVGDQPLRDLVWALHDGGHAGGVIEFDGASERPGSVALSDMRISLRPLDPTFRTPLPAPSAPPDLDRRFQIVGVAPGRYAVRVSLPDGSAWRLQRVVVGGIDVTDLPLNVTGSVDGIRVVLTDQPSPSVSGRARLTTPGDQSVGVVLFPSDEMLWPDAPNLGGRSQYQRLAADGTFAFSGVPDGAYLVAAVDDVDAGEWPDPAWLARLSRVATPIAVSNGRAGAALALTVVVVR